MLILTNFQSKLFEGSQRLIELSDELINLGNLFGSKCSLCSKTNAQINARFIDDEIVFDGREVDTTKGNYKIVCWNCWF